jgi:D-alanyl-D-alanine carboxypeptidase/D-alanyl-D-alanine-endopeptidase (penicillin-binding protein 4)
MDRSLFGVVLQGPDGKQLYGRNADRMFIPASNTKLVVSAVAAALLPPEWTVKTSVYANGPVRGGVVEGDLILYGRGDPTMSAIRRDTTAAGACDDALRLRELRASSAPAA